MDQRGPVEASGGKIGANRVRGFPNCGDTVSQWIPDGAIHVLMGPEEYDLRRGSFPVIIKNATVDQRWIKGLEEGRGGHGVFWV